MLKNALLYTEELAEKFKEIQYNPKYRFLNWRTGTDLHTPCEDNSNRHSFVSVNENDEILGWISYDIDWLARSAWCFGAASFVEGGSVTFVRDLHQAIDDIFTVYNLNRVEWHCYSDNPAVRGYLNFVKKNGGRVAAHLRQNMLLMDGQIHDTLIFEILKEEYDAKKNNIMELK